MPLDEYQRKRDFGRTPEPAGHGRTDQQAIPRAVGGRFVVQRHRATRLHYDVRLEIEGVLVSWAVPRGPTLDPAEKRMAIHVEDHPIEYLDFEGVIPSRQYGAGDVIVWDWGTFEPEAPTTEPREAIVAGELKFILRGEKLRGRFTIVRTSGRGGSRSSRAGRSVRPSTDEGDGDQWLLIHKRDAEAVAGWDAEDHPRSVKSGRTNDEVRAGADALWISAAPAPEAEIDLSAARPAPLPGFVEPMLADTATRPFSNPDWLFEIKWDGFRVQAIVKDGAVRLKTRNGNDAAGYFPELAATRPTWIDAREAVLDGEVVALEETGVPDFSLLQKQLARRPGDPSSVPLVYEVFDLLHIDGRSLLDVPLEDRKRLLRSVLRDTTRVRFSGHVVGDGEAFHASAAERHLEGIIAKHRRSRYEPGRRVSTWLKLKLRPEQELVVGGWSPGRTAPNDLGAVIVGVHEDGALRHAGRVGTGWNARGRTDLLARLRALETDRSPFTPPLERTGEHALAHWVRPELVIRAELAGWSVDGVVRQASYKGIEPERDPRTVVRERSIAPEEAEARAAEETDPARAATAAELAALDAIHAEGRWRVGSNELKVTNLDKVLFPPPVDARPDEGPITKRELIRYFVSIAPVLIPHLAGRALNMTRYPDGVGGKSFWQKDVPATAPAWLHRWRETGVEERDANTHLVADRVEELAWLANQASFEVHAWTSRIAAPDRPTFALVDIDPGEATSWDEVLVLARLYRTAFEHLGVTGFPKTTGKRGLQVWVPVDPIYTFAETSAWVEGISRAIGALVPDIVSWEWAVAERGGRARLDYTQNASIRTLVAPYAVRPIAGAPVSAPLRWDELDDPGLRPTSWTIRSIVARVAELGDLFAGAQTLRQRLPPLG